MSLLHKFRPRGSGADENSQAPASFSLMQVAAYAVVAAVHSRPQLFDYV